jgi:hypothetical protein
MQLPGDAMRRANELWLEIVIWQLKEGHIASQIVRTRYWDNRVLTCHDGTLLLDGERRHFRELIAARETSAELDIDDPPLVGSRAGSKIFPSHTDRGSQEWIERKAAEVSLERSRARSEQHASASTLRTLTILPPAPILGAPTNGVGGPSTTKRERLQLPAVVRVEPHPKLPGQFGVFSKELLQSGDIVYREKVVVTAAIPTRLCGTDHYIAYTVGQRGRKARADLYLILKDEATSQASITYNLNSAAPIAGVPNELDPSGRGANVELRVSDINLARGSCYLTARSTRRIKVGDEVLWAYDVHTNSARTLAESSDDRSFFEVVVTPTQKRPLAKCPKRSADAATSAADAPTTNGTFAREDETPQSIASELGLCVDTLLAERTVSGPRMP